MKKAQILVTLLWISVLALPAVVADEGTVYGEGLTDAKPVKIAELLGSPDDWVGKKVRITGKIDDVCPKAGCWIDIREPDGEQTLRFKVRDGVIVFPLEAKGKPVTAEGVFTKIELDEEQTVSYLRHMAEERGESFDPAEVDGPLTIFQIRGEGAVVR